MSEKLKKIITFSGLVLAIILLIILLVLVKQNSKLKAEIVNLSNTPATTLNTQSPSSSATATINSSAVSKTSTQTLTPVPSPAKSDELLLREAYAAKTSTSIDEISIDISKQSDNSVYGTVSVSGGGGWFVAAKISGDWKIIADGNGTIECSSLEGYDIPASVVEECYDPSTETLKKR
jgi:hypothetical protein